MAPTSGVNGLPVSTASATIHDFTINHPGASGQLFDFAVGNYNLTVNGNLAFTVLHAGNDVTRLDLIIDNGTLTINGSATFTADATGTNLETIHITTTASGFTTGELIFKGDVTMTGDIDTYLGYMFGKIIFDAPVSQTFTDNISADIPNFANTSVEIGSSNNPVVTFAGTPTGVYPAFAPLGDLNINGTSTLDLGTKLITRKTAGGTFTIASGATLKLAGLAASSNFPLNFNVNTLNGTVEYNAASAQTISKTSTGTFPATVFQNLTLSGVSAGANLKTLGVNTTINGILSVEGSGTNPATFALGGFALTWGAAATLQYKASGVAQTAGVTATAEFTTPFNGTGGLIINNASGVTLTEAKTLGASSKLTLTSGVLSIGANNLILSNTSAASLVYTDGFVYSTSGVFRRNITSNTSTYLFPVGNGTASTNRHRVGFVNNSLDLTGVTDYLDLSVTDVTQSAFNVDSRLSLSTNYTQGGDAILLTAGQASTTNHTITWTFAPSNTILSGNYGVQLYVENTTLSGSDDYMFCPMKRPDASTDYQDYVTNDATTTFTASTYASGYTQRTGYTAFSKHIIGKSATALPVKLLEFSGQCDNHKTVLNWSTASETNNNYFTIERSSLSFGEGWGEVGTIPGAGNSSTIKHYSFDDMDPLQGKSYYRLTQTDYNGESENFAPLVVACADNPGFSINVNSNPPGDDGNIYISVNGAADKNVLLVLTNVLGQEVYSKATLESADSYLYSINMGSSIAPGMYFVTASSKDEYVSKKIVVR